MRAIVTTRYTFRVEAELDVSPVESNPRAGVYYMPQQDMRAYDEAERLLPKAEATLRKLLKSKKIAHDRFDVETMIDRRDGQLIAIFSTTGQKTVVANADQETRQA